MYTDSVTKVKAIIFDCFGVLTSARWHAFLDSLPDGVDIEAARAVHRAYDAGIISKEVNASQIEEITGHSYAEIDDISSEEIVKNSLLLEYIRELKDRGYKIGLLSNIASNWIRDSLLADQEQALFDVMIMSFETGIIKPDPRMFEMVCEKLDVLPEEAIMVDDIDRYCAAAEAVGMQAVIYRDFKQAKQQIEEQIAG